VYVHSSIILEITPSEEYIYNLVHSCNGSRRERDKGIKGKVGKGARNEDMKEIILR
jgi:hypothetical protein